MPTTRLTKELNTNSFYAKYPVRILKDFLKNYTNHTRLYKMNKGYMVDLLDKENIDKTTLPEPPVRGMRTYGIAYGRVKPYNEREQKLFMSSQYNELHPLLSKKLNPKKQKTQFERNLKIVLNKHQKNFVVNFINGYFKGGLLFHSVGSGKTLTAVVFSHYYLSLYPTHNVVIISPPSLLFNFVDGMKEYGLDIRDSRYKFETYLKFLKNPLSYVDNKSLLIIDEVHNFRTEYRNIPGKTKSNVKFGALMEACQVSNKVLSMTGTAFVNRLYDIENIMATIDGGRPPLTPHTFQGVVDNDDNIKDYFEYRISYFNIFDTAEARFFPKVNEIYQPIDLRDVFKLLYIKVASGQNIFTKPYPGKTEYIKLDELLGYVDNKLTTKFYKPPEIDNYATLAQRVLSGEVQVLLPGTTNEYKDKPILRKYESLKAFYNASRQYSNLVAGAKTKFIVKKIMDNPTYKSIIYSSFISSSIQPLRQALTRNKIKFVLITGSENSLQRNKNKELFNDIKSGVNVLIISRAGTEGVSTRNCRQFFMYEAQWNEATTEQATARAIRFKSHFELPENQRFVNVYKLCIVLTDDDRKILKALQSGDLLKQGMKDVELRQKFNLKLKRFIKSDTFKSFQETDNYKRYIKKEQKDRHEYFDMETSNVFYVLHEPATANNPSVIKLRQDYNILTTSLSEKAGKVSMLKTVSSDLIIYRNSIDKQIKINSFIKVLNDKIPQIEDFKEPYHRQLIKFIDEEKDVSKLLKKQRELLDKNAIQSLKRSEKTNMLLQNSQAQKLAQKQATEKKLKSAEKYQEFFTPDEVADKLLSYSKNIKKNYFINILEPTAGFGSLVRAIIKARTKYTDSNFNIDMCEINPENRIQLKKLYVKSNPYQLNLMNEPNFLNFVPSKRYDLIVMNPPFHLKKSLNEGLKKDLFDMDFIIKAYEWLKPGGEMLIIASTYLDRNTFYKNFIKTVELETIKIYENYKWKGTKEKDTQAKKTTLRLNFGIYYIRKDESTAVEEYKENVAMDEKYYEPVEEKIEPDDEAGTLLEKASEEIADTYRQKKKKSDVPSFLREVDLSSYRKKRKPEKKKTESVNPEEELEQLRRQLSMDKPFLTDFNTGKWIQ